MSVASAAGKHASDSGKSSQEGFARLVVVVLFFLRLVISTDIRSACNTCRLKRKKVCRVLSIKCPVADPGSSAMVSIRVLFVLTTNLSVFIPRNPADEGLPLAIYATQKPASQFLRSSSDYIYQNYPRNTAKILSSKLPRLCSQRPSFVHRMFGMHTRHAGPGIVRPPKLSNSS